VSGGGKIQLETYKYHSLGDYSDTYVDMDNRFIFDGAVSILIKYISKMLILLMLLGRPDGARAPHAQARYKRTDKKLFIKQLARIEGARRVFAAFGKTFSRRSNWRDVAKTPHEHHHIGASQNHLNILALFFEGIGRPSREGTEYT